MTNASIGNLERMLGSGRSGESARRNSQQLCGDIDIRIGRDGTWFYHGSPIGRKSLVKLFSSVLTRDALGDYWLITPAEMARIRVDDAPFTAVEMTVTGSGRNRVLSFRTNIDEIVIADAAHPIRVETDRTSGEPSPYVMVRDGLEALILRAVFYDLVALGEATREGDVEILTVWSKGCGFPLGRLSDA
jgi:uncharacterized protein